MRKYIIQHNYVVLDELAAYPYCKIMPRKDKLIVHGCMTADEISDTPYTFKLKEGSLRLPSSFILAYGIAPNDSIKGEMQYYRYEYKSEIQSNRRKVVLYATCTDIPVLPPVKAATDRFSFADYRQAKEIPVKRCFNEIYLDKPLLSNTEYIMVTARMGEMFRIEVKNATIQNIKRYPNIGELKAEYGHRLQSFCGKELTWIESNSDRIHVPKKFFIDADIKNEDKFAVFAHKKSKKKFVIAPAAEDCAITGERIEPSVRKAENVTVCEECDDSVESGEFRAVLEEVAAMKEMLKVMVEKQKTMKDEYEARLEEETRKNKKLVEKLKAIVEAL